MPVQYAAVVRNHRRTGAIFEGINMTSEQRREARYQRRKARRQARKERHDAPYTFETVASREALRAAARQCAKGVSFKEPVKRFGLNELCNVATLSDKLTSGQPVSRGFCCFTLIERGKARDIMSVHFSERVVQKALNQNVLVPVLLRRTIYGNGASQKGKGVSFAIRRLKTHLARHYRRYGTEGYVLVCDIKGYFGSMRHDRCKAIVRQAVNDERLCALHDQITDEYAAHKRRYRGKNGLPPDEDECTRGLGLGSEINQTIAIMYLDPLDHYVKEVLRIKGYQRFNDDFYLIHPDKQYLEFCLGEIRDFCAGLGLTLNERKTHVVKLSHGFTFLKNKVNVTETGKIILRPARECITRERRKIKRQAGLLQRGEMDFAAILCSYTSWRGSIKYRNAHRSVRNMDALFNQLFIESWAPQRKEPQP